MPLCPVKEVPVSVDTIRALRGKNPHPACRERVERAASGLVRC